MYRMCVCVCVCRVCVCVPVGGVNALFDSLIRSLLLSLLSLLSSPPVGCTLLAAQTPLLSPHSPQCCQTGLTAAGFVFQKCSSTERGREGERERAIVSSQGQRGERRRGRTGVIFRAGPTVILMPCVCVAGPQEEAMLGSAGWATPEELSEQASQAQHLERLAQLCIMSKQPHLALEYSGKATKIHQRTFGNDHPITARSLELMATVYAEIGKTEYSDSLGQCVSALSKRFAAAESIRDTVNCLPHSHREKHSEVRHRKDPHHQQEDTQKAKVTNGRVPTSILKRPGPNYGSDTEPTHRRKGERRVRFREPETTVHDIPYSDCLGGKSGSKFSLTVHERTLCFQRIQRVRACVTCILLHVSPSPSLSPTPHQPRTERCVA
ncbi:nutritionally-regulated adipose and cardiac enriched protein homolog isoform X5 [Genypterus blacodes]|uniref:nutritionally-regulated adipose and cardiac enriched protein homolog isoform X5 n=1 Tax=Genypterus blacodes TaxID=154954 RepID=UPI003F772B2F